MKYEILCVGKTPLLMHADNVDGTDRLKAWRSDPKNKSQSVAGDDRSPAWTWHEYCYCDGENIAIPCDNIIKSLVAAATVVRVIKNTTLKKFVAGGLFVTSEFGEFRTHGKQVPWSFVQSLRDLPFAEQRELCQKEYNFDLWPKRAPVVSAKHVRVRPRFDNWQLSFTLQVVDEKNITRDRLEMCLEQAGLNGHCDWRPSAPRAPGPYGIFEAKIVSAKK